MTARSLVRFAWLSVAASLAIIGLKAGAYALTGSVGLLSDALESVVNLVASCAAVVALTVAARPADDDHPFGHEKAEYFSSGLEGGLIFVASIGIALVAVERLIHPAPLEHLGLGLALSAVATLINLGVARVLLDAGRRYESIALEADARHLMTDVWTSVGVFAGVGAAATTGLTWLDPVVALAVAANIVRAGVALVRRSVHGLMDASLPAAEVDAVRSILDELRPQGIDWHALRTRRSGSRRFIEMHVLVPGAWTVQLGHDLAEEIEARIRERLARTTVTIHLEPIEAPESWHDAGLDRTVSPADRTAAPPPPRPPGA